MRKAIFAAALGVAVIGAPAYAGDKPKKGFVVVNEDVGVPVFPHDITDRPYEVVGPIETNVRKATIFSKEASQKKIYRELWERGEKLGADAVVNASYGDARVTVTSWGATKATGTAIRFTGAAATTTTP